MATKVRVFRPEIDNFYRKKPIIKNMEVSSLQSKPLAINDLPQVITPTAYALPAAFEASDLEGSSEKIRAYLENIRNTLTLTQAQARAYPLSLRYYADLGITTSNLASFVDRFGKILLRDVRETGFMIADFLLKDLHSSETSSFAADWPQKFLSTLVIVEKEGQFYQFAPGDFQPRASYACSVVKGFPHFEQGNVDGGIDFLLHSDGKNLYLFLENSLKGALDEQSSQVCYDVWDNAASFDAGTKISMNEGTSIFWEMESNGGPFHYGVRSQGNISIHPYFKGDEVHVSAPLVSQDEEVTLSFTATDVFGRVFSDEVAVTIIDKHEGTATPTREITANLSQLSAATGGKALTTDGPTSKSGDMLVKSVQIEGDAEPPRYQVLFLIDASGSMDAVADQLAQKAGEVVDEIWKQVPENGLVEIGLAYYGNGVTYPVLLFDPTNTDKEDLAEDLKNAAAQTVTAIRNSKIGTESLWQTLHDTLEGETFLWDLDTFTYRKIVVLTDTEAFNSDNVIDTGNPDSTWTKEEAIAIAQSKNVTINTIVWDDPSGLAHLSIDELLNLAQTTPSPSTRAQALDALCERALKDFSITMSYSDLYKNRYGRFNTSFYYQKPGYRALASEFEKRARSDDDHLKPGALVILTCISSPSNSAKYLDIMRTGLKSPSDIFRQVSIYGVAKLEDAVSVPILMQLARHSDDEMQSTSNFAYSRLGIMALKIPSESRSIISFLIHTVINQPPYKEETRAAALSGLLLSPIVYEYSSTYYKEKFLKEDLVSSLNLLVGEGGMSWEDPYSRAVFKSLAFIFDQNSYSITADPKEHPRYYYLPAVADLGWSQFRSEVDLFRSVRLDDCILRVNEGTEHELEMTPIAPEVYNLMRHLEKQDDDYTEYRKDDDYMYYADP